ncbi:MAG: AlkA N-terminal domain-containing protein [Gaiellaceae bacterium]
MTFAELEFDRCYLALESRDRRFDGRFIAAVRSTGIYCRPSCPTPTHPKRINVRFYPTAAAAQIAGFRACKRCRPDATPGSPEWNARGDLVGRAMRLIGDGVVDREGVPGLARRLAVSDRHLNRLLVGEVGAPPLALARARRAQTARVLIETTELGFADVAFAAGFSSVRQFNDTIGSVFAATPTALRSGKRGRTAAAGEIELRLPFRRPLDAERLLGWLSHRAVAGVEEAGVTYRRTLRLPHGSATVELEPAEDCVVCRARLDQISDLATLVARCRRLLDLDADPAAVADVLAADPLLAPQVQVAPGLRAPGAVDGAELAIRAVVGQQISVAGAVTILGRLASSFGEPLPEPDGGLVRLFPTVEAIAEADLTGHGLTRTRERTLRGLCRAVADGELSLDPGADRNETERRLLALPGIGPWTASYVVMRALGDPDAFPSSDLGLLRGARPLGLPGTPATLAARAEHWRPWRSYAAQYLWAAA